MKKASIPFKLTAIRLRQLQLFEAAAELGSISEAARQLNMSQPAATEMLKGLERAFAVQLFVGTSRGIMLTEQGKRVALRTSSALREILTANEEASGDIPVGEVIRVCMAPPAMYTDLPRAIQNFIETNPRILLNLRESNVADSVHALLQDEVDVVITGNDPAFSNQESGDQIFVKPLPTDYYQLFISATAHLDDGWTATPESIRNLSWILPIKDSFVRGMLDDWFLTRGLSPPSSYIELTPLTVAIEMLRTFPYVALLPAGLSRTADFNHLIPIADEVMSLPIKLVVACKRRQFGRPAVSAFVDDVVAACGGMDVDGLD
jgi:DNA-binding transcriptional LysR family regulator